MTSIFRTVTAVSRNNGRHNVPFERETIIVTSDDENYDLDAELAGVTTADVFAPIAPAPADGNSPLERNNPHPIEQRAGKIANLRSEFRTKAWAFTINNYTDECCEYLANKLADDSSIGYCVIGKEICPRTGTPHLQGYIRFTTVKGKRMQTVQKALGYYWSQSRVGHGCWANLAPAKKGDLANKRYCEKECLEGWRVELGEPQKPQREGQGARNDYNDAFDIIEASTFSGEGEIELARKIPEHYLKHGKMVIRLRNVMQMKENPNGETRKKGHNIIWIFGRTGKGKSHFVEKELADKNFYMKGPGPWWDFYDMQEYLWIDDFRKDYFKFHYFLKLLDRYRMMAQYKGGYTRLRFHTTYITCPVHPATMFGNKWDNADQLLDRIYKRGNGQIIEAIEHGNDGDEVDEDGLRPGTEPVVKLWSKDESYELLRSIQAFRDAPTVPRNSGGPYDDIYTS